MSFSPVQQAALVALLRLYTQGQRRLEQQQRLLAERLQVCLNSSRAESTSLTKTGPPDPAQQHRI